MREYWVGKNILHQPVQGTEKESHSYSWNVNLMPIRHFILDRRIEGRFKVKCDELALLSKLFYELTCIRLDFSKMNPLTVIETLLLGLRVILIKRSDLAYVLGTKEPTIRFYENNISHKLRISDRSQALYIAMRKKIVQFMV